MGADNSNTHAQDDQNAVVVKSGFLMKESAHLKQYRRRWIVLKGTSLLSFKKQSDNESTEVFSLLEYTNVEEVLETKFKLISSDGDRTFEANTKQDMLEWVECIKKVHNDNPVQSEEEEEEDDGGGMVGGLIGIGAGAALMGGGGVGVVDDDDDGDDDGDDD